ncbi:MAG: PadR family transcriptional regulator [Sphingobacteriia bacterium 24-36-13]|uniref:PadR family transcriptional regulator n=1 Tax=Sediminibacterium sp. TaxID=1917865 RepID=UPI000BDCC49E|nr:PadR family transcriptional regulator [Sediminibacterium sp.]OYY08734.1 MAG: PadR family transcriptional regulator [Sphingobacteriia bacterium 35-36-14]OYZ51898.1 MAG: PadR family transcriptional regulator [Sphingobacteriia bacterium 24-36-13]OZA63025.1 MAG: PadR family transcriptional regulator [Sphingobacteriia bacterium 39-36-14]MBT9483778.1 helix-turn-helix transcriptional regulator [Sediminibacterium sp.]HQS36134.1 PadR family transcriptional regulator [Sediminibacterium sp.]
MKKSSLYKGCLEPILLRLLKDNGRMYGYQMTQMVKEITKGELNITEGALYPLLHKLEEQGVVETETEMNGNRMRKYYSLTKAGKKQTALAMDEMKAFMQSLEFIVNPKPVVG